MNTTAILHIPGTVDACPIDGGRRMHLRLRTARGDFASATLIYQCSRHAWWDTRLQAEMHRCFTDSEFDYYSVTVELTDTRFVYIFQLTAPDGATRFLSEDGVTEDYDYSLAFFNYFQYASMFQSEIIPVPEWVRGAAAYQIFPERFASSGGEKPWVNTPWGGAVKPKSFCGGDLWGLIEKLDYLSQLGVNLLYLNPVFCAPSNHKYDIFDYFNVDPQFGGNEALQALIVQAHARGIRVMLDGVFNHCASGHPIFQDVVKHGRASKYYDWFFVDGDFPDEKKVNYKTFATVSYMPKLNTANPEVIRYFCDVAVHWMKNYGVDCWRLDVSDELSHRFLREFRDCVLSQNPEAILIGEDWHRAERSLNGDEYDGLMNYGLTKALLDFFAFETIDAARLRDRLVRLLWRTNISTNEKQFNLLDSHDTERFLTRLNGDAKKHRAALAIQFFFPGIPSVYYGDEIGLLGGYDPDCRRCFDWNEAHWDTETYELVKRLMHLKHEPALARGDFSIDETDGILTLTRRADTQVCTLRLNASRVEKDGLAPNEFVIQ